jgi:cytoskeletal protein CcmA (bactofilin family)
MSAATSFGTETFTTDTVLGNYIKVTGEIRCREPLTIEGEVEGIIDVAGYLLTIAPSGNVRASIKAKEIDVLGSLQGNVEGADKIYIRNGARFVGDIQALGIVIEDGGFLCGKVELLRQTGVSKDTVNPVRFDDLLSEKVSVLTGDNKCELEL